MLFHSLQNIILIEVAYSKMFNHTQFQDPARSGDSVYLTSQVLSAAKLTSLKLKTAKRSAL